MIANAQQVVFRIGEKEIVVIGVWAVPRIREPEVLPYNYAVAIGSFVEGVVAGLSHPVTNHVEVLVAVIAHGGFVFARAIAEHRFGKSPVAAAGNESASVDPYLEQAAVFGISELTDTGSGKMCCRRFCRRQTKESVTG
jgi:hypothetical protein